MDWPPGEHSAPGYNKTKKQVYVVFIAKRIELNRQTVRSSMDLLSQLTNILVLVPQIQAFLKVINKTEPIASILNGLSQARNKLFRRGKGDCVFSQPFTQ